MADARLTAVRLLQKMDSGGGYSNIILDSALGETDLSPKDKAFAAALFYGVIERRLTLDYIIENHAGASTLPLMDEIGRYQRYGSDFGNII